MVRGLASRRTRHSGESETELRDRVKLSAVDGRNESRISTRLVDCSEHQHTQRVSIIMSIRSSAPLSSAFALASLLSVCSATQEISFAAQGGTKFAVSVNTDAMQTVPFPTVTIGQFGAAQQLVGEYDGGTETVDWFIDFPTVVRIGETPVTTRGNQFTGTTLGQHFTYIPDESGAADGARLNYYQPTARRIGFYAPLAVSDSESGWIAYGSPNATYGFEALIAELPTKEVVSNFLAFEIGIHADVFQHGLVLRCDSTVDLGSEGIVFRIDRRGYDYGGPDPWHSRQISTIRHSRASRIRRSSTWTKR